MEFRTCSRRAKVFGDGPGWPMDRNAKARIMVFAAAWTARHKQPGQHRGPITRAFMEVLEALLWGFHNAHTGRCFPSYETIAAKAECSRDTVYEAIKVLERAGILSWAHRLAHIRVREIDLFGQLAWRKRVIRTSNAYTFRDPIGAAAHPEVSKSENPTGTMIQDSQSLKTTVPAGHRPLDPSNPLDAALLRLGRCLGAVPETPGGVPAG
ncbi:helix-turn-helix domain-containing protein [Dankookia sp. GCM10030260]|uniref:helix-turn-helix domain-containing protein n=1 Tax=Dankookia sp. GCM10030260 TaxID=3273390 RepID=UPI00360B16C0